LIGRPLAETDFADLRALHRDERVVAAFHAAPNSDEETRDFLNRKLAHWRDHGFGIWMFRDEDGEFVGRCGIHRWQFEDLDGVELGYIVRSDLWGQGYATEMGLAVMRHAAEALGMGELVGFTLQDNVLSRRVLEKLGFQFDREFVDEDGEDVVLYRRALAGVSSRPAGWFDPDISKWDAWRPEQVARRLEHVGAPWYVAAGWAIDLFLGGTHREHEDLEIAVPDSRFDEIVAAFPELEFCVITGPGEAMPLERARDRLEQTHQTWVREPETSVWRFDVFREPSEAGMWVCRRDETLRLRYDQVILRTQDGIPYCRPEIALLFKAKHSHRERDQADFEAVVPQLEPDRRRWLAKALERVHPDHPWLVELLGPEGPA
jgi:RimJ/RimL family protein N-acetyltransferase